MRCVKNLGLLFLAVVLSLNTGCFRPYTIPETSSGADTQPTLGTVGTDRPTRPDSSTGETSGSDGSTADTSDSGSSGTSGSGSGSQSTSTTIGSQITTTTGGKTTTAPKPTDPVSPPASAEMKGVWISYIELNAMLKNQSVSSAKAAIDKVMDNCVSYGLNTVFFHVRANSDAYYKSSIFKPAASVGNLIRSGFDPLAYAVSSAHSHGLQLHAWVNPYRIGTDLSYRVAGADYFSKTSGGTTRYYYVPTAASAQKLILDGLRELVANYAIDGIQYDDYFYPTGLMSSSVESFEQADYEASGKRLSVADWRRAAVDTLVMGSYNVAHSKSGVVFGISPGHDHTKNYNQMYADTAKWLRQKGYVDYLCPQLYFGFEHSSAPFDKMVDQWMSRPRASGVNLYVGLAIYKAGIADDIYAGAGRTEWANHNDIMKRSVETLRAKKVPGMIFYSYTFFESAKQETANLLPLLK